MWQKKTIMWVGWILAFLSQPADYIWRTYEKKVKRAHQQKLETEMEAFKKILKVTGFTIVRSQKSEPGGNPEDPCVQLVPPPLA